MADKGQAASAINIAALCALFACGAAVAADDTATPDMEFLEYLGSWEESDEDWVLLAAEAVARVAAEMKGTDAASKKADSVETDDEN